jgi:hypothetical protein
VKLAEVVQDLSLAVVVRVEYDTQKHPAVSFGPVLFFIEVKTKLVSRMETEFTHLRTPDGQVHTTRQVLVMQRPVIDQTPRYSFSFRRRMPRRCSLECAVLRSVAASGAAGKQSGRVGVR